MRLNQIPAPEGATHKRKRLGRGESSGHGKTSGRGHKGQKARAGGFHKRGFEGGQMPLQRRLPKRGFTPIDRKEYEIVNVGLLSKFKDQVDPVTLAEEGLVRKNRLVKILGEGDLKSALTVKAHRFSESAKQKIEKAGGTVVVEGSSLGHLA